MMANELGWNQGVPVPVPAMTRQDVKRIPRHLRAAFGRSGLQMKTPAFVVSNRGQGHYSLRARRDARGIGPQVSRIISGARYVFVGGKRYSRKQALHIILAALKHSPVEIVVQH